MLKTVLNYSPKFTDKTIIEILTDRENLSGGSAGRPSKELEQCYLQTVGPMQNPRKYISFKSIEKPGG